MQSSCLLRGPCRWWRAQRRPICCAGWAPTGAPLHGAPPPFEVRADDTIAIGGCVIDTQSGQIDARLDIQLDENARLAREALPDQQPELRELAA